MNGRVVQLTAFGQALRTGGSQLLLHLGAGLVAGLGERGDGVAFFSRHQLAVGAGRGQLLLDLARVTLLCVSSAGG